MKYSAILCSFMLALAGHAQTANPLTLEQALTLARTNSPALQAASLEVDAAMASIRAAGMWINPSLRLNAEGIGGDLDLYKDAEYTLGIQQKFLRGGKQNLARNAARLGAGVFRYSAAETMLQLEYEVRLAFVEMQAQQEIGKVRDEQMELSRALVEVTRRRLEAGAGSELEKVQAELVLEETTLAQTCCFGDLAAAKARLASLVGLSVVELEQVAGDFYEIGRYDDLTVHRSHPILMRLDTEADRLDVEAARARAQDVADITFGAAYRHEAASDVDTFVLSASIPLGFSKRGRAEHAAVMMRASAVRVSRMEARRKLQQQLDTLREQHKGAAMEATLTRDSLMPKAEQAYAISRAGYEAGRFSWLELISAQQHLADIRIRYIESLLAVHRIEAELTKFQRTTS